MGGLVVLLVIALAGCDAFYSVRGTIRSCAGGAPIEGARVQIAYDGEHGSALTDRSGQFRVAANDPPGDEVSRLTAEARGYRTATRSAGL